jgi:alpha/beta superfamily hydrolase
VLETYKGDPAVVPAMTPPRNPDHPPADTRRRRLLQAAGGVVLTALAGCAGDGDDGGEESTAAEPTSATMTGTETTTEATTTDEPTTTTVSEDSQRETALRLVDLLAEGDYETAHGLLSPSVREQSSVSGLQSAWEQTAGESGAFVGTTGVERTTSQGYDVLVVRAQFEAGLVAVQVAFRGASVEGIQFLPAGGSYSPPSYADQSVFSERDLTLDSPVCGLGATLSTPEDGAETGVVLVHGSGPNDRDGTFGPNKPLQDLAWGLASEGIAALRYDKRTYACDVATDELGFGPLVVDDALTALDRLRAETDVADAAVVGHSLGGYAAPRIASEDGDASAFLLAAPSRPLYELVPDQVRYLASLDGEVTDAEQAQIDAAEATSDRLAAGNYEDGGFPWGAAFWRDVADYDPVSVATGLDRSVYALQGGRDYQVSPTEDFPAWRDALGDDRTRLYDDLNHLFVPGEGDPSPAEYFRAGNVAGTVVSDLAGWLTA